MILLYLLVIIFGIIALALLIKIFGYLYPYFFWGGINVSSTKEKIKKIVDLSGAKAGQTVIDLGSGNGELLIALANTGATVIGYEINPLLVTTAKKNIKEAGIHGRATVFCGNLWNQNLKNFDVVVAYPMKHMMKKLEEKFEKELKTGTKVVLNYFALPTWKPEKVEDNVYLYIKK